MPTPPLSYMKTVTGNHCRVFHALHPGPDLSWRQYMCHLTNQDEGIFKDNLREILLER